MQNNAYVVNSMCQNVHKNNMGKVIINMDLLTLIALKSWQTATHRNRAK